MSDPEDEQSDIPASHHAYFRERAAERGVELTPEQVEAVGRSALSEARRLLSEAGVAVEGKTDTEVVDLYAEWRGWPAGEDG